ncbi:MAG: T9SS type A sorting domain-containing protein [Ferruginibacter sp.]
MLETGKSIDIYPNPVTGDQMNISFKNQPQGNYQVKLFNKLGQAVYNGSITISSVNQVASIQITGRINLRDLSVDAFSRKGKSHHKTGIYSINNITHY